MSKRSAPGAMIIHFLGGIHELYFPYVLMKPLTIIAMIAGGMSGTGCLTYWTVVWWLAQVRGLSLLTGTDAERLVPGDNCRCYGRYHGVLCYYFADTEDGKTVETESEDEFAQSANAVKAMKQEGAFSLSRVKRIAFVCDAGMGSSAMGATTFRKRPEKAGLAIEVKHYAIENVPADADIVVTHASLEGRVKRVTDKPLILINNYIGDPKLDTLFNQLTAEHKH